MARAGRIQWFWLALWMIGLAAAAALPLLYGRLPVDGATGDLGSFTAGGFRVQWLLEQRAGGLQVDDLIVSAGGHTVDEWLSGADRGPEWRTGGTVVYEVLRGGKLETVVVRLAPVPLPAILKRWASQLLVAAAFIVVGTFAFLKRRDDRAAQMLMLFLVATAVQYTSDAWNLQYVAAVWRWPFWIYLFYEHVSYGVGVASVCMFALVFPARNPILSRYPRAVPVALYGLLPLMVLTTLFFAPRWSALLRISNLLTWVIALLEFALAIGASLRSVLTARDPVSRAQIRWILWCGALGCLVAVPFYIVPAMLQIRPLLPHPVLMIFVALAPFAFATAILRYRLFDIELVINRTLVYLTLTALLIGLYFGSVAVLTEIARLLLRRESSTFPVVFAAVTIALTFAPLRRRVQMTIDRMFYRRKLDYQRLLPEMTEELAKSIVLSKLAALLRSELPQRLQIESAALLVLDPAGDSYQAVGDGAASLPSDHPLVAHLTGGRAVQRLLPPEGMPAGIRGYLDSARIELCIPLDVGGQLVGIYNLGRKLSGDAYTREETRLLEILGKQAAIAVQNSRLFEAERTQRELAQALHQAASAVNSTLDLDQVLDRIMDQIVRVIRGDQINIMFIDGEMATIVRGRGAQHSDAPVRVSLDPILREVLVHRRPLWMTHAQEEGRDPPFRSTVCAPIQIGETIVGVLNVHGRRPGQFDRTDAERLDAFTHHAAAAIANARLYEQAQSEIAERKKTEKRIVASLEEKEVLLKEIHHRVKNNLQVVSSLLALQSLNIKDEKILALFQNSRMRVNAMALVHETLYRSRDLARVDLAEYIRSLADHIIATSELLESGAALELDIDPMQVSVDTAMPCGLLLNELILNSLKHAFRDRGEGRIRITVRSVPPGDIVMLVSDNGRGFPAGVDFRKTSSLGLQLVNTLVTQLGGTIELAPAPGTCFTVRFPNPSTAGS